MIENIENLAYLLGEPVATAKIKESAEDFVVIEDLGFDFSQTGEHIMLRVKKRGENTKYVVNELAKYCGVPSKKAGWAGLKDRHAVTEQWISIQLPGKEAPDFSAFEVSHPGVEILTVERHNKKLRPGDLKGNKFELILKDVTNMDDIKARIEQIKTLGVPNYFGEQRFGRDGNNLISARKWGAGEMRVRDKSKRSFYLSAARSHLFNQVLAYRLANSMTQSLIVGDIVMDSSEKLIDVTDENIGQLQTGLISGEYALTGPMAGDNALTTSGEIEKLEQSIIDKEPELLQVLRDNRMRQERRPLMLAVDDLSYEMLSDSQLKVSFSLTAGSFATSVVRELMKQEVEC